MSDKKTIEIFCDGSCLGNPGPGGWGAIIRDENGEREMSGGKKNTTNNVMELTATLESLKKIAPKSRINITSDSQYVTKGMTEWIHSWIKNGWKTSAKKPVKNQKLWEELHSIAGRHEIEWIWIRGHAGHPENERCDALAYAAAEKQR